MKKMKVVLLMAVIMVAIVMKALAQEKSSVTPNVLADGNGAKKIRVENTHMVRFIEIFLATPDPKTGKLVAACYNTLLTTSPIPASKDTAPLKLVEGLNFEKMKQEYGVKGASLN